MESRLEKTIRVLYPATVRSQQAESAFQQGVKAFREAVVTEEKQGLLSGVSEGLHAARLLRNLAGLLKGQPRAATASQLAADVEQFTQEAGTIYGELVNHPYEAATRTDIATRGMAARTADLAARVRDMRERLSRDLKEELAQQRSRSIAVRWMGLVILLLTMAVSTVLVNWTIRKVIAKPLMEAEAEAAYERDLLRILFDSIPDCIYFKDAESRFTRINKAQSRLLGIECESAAKGRSDFDFFDAEHAAQAFEDEREIIQMGQAIISRIERVSGRGHQERWMTSTKVPIRDQDGLVTGIVGVSRDVTDWKRAVEALEKSRESFRALFAVIPHAVWVYDANTFEFLEVNEAAVQGLWLFRPRIPGDANRRHSCEDRRRTPAESARHTGRQGRKLEASHQERPGV